MSREEIDKYMAKYSKNIEEIDNLAPLKTLAEKDSKADSNMQSEAVNVKNNVASFCSFFFAQIRNCFC